MMRVLLLAAFSCSLLPSVIQSFCISSLKRPSLRVLSLAAEDDFDVTSTEAEQEQYEETFIMDGFDLDDLPLAFDDLEEDDEEEDGEYVFDFGKYKGMALDDVPGSYLDFIVETKKIWQFRPELRRALVQREMIEDVAPSGYVFDFGKYQGQPLEDANESYINFLVETKDIWKKRPDLKEALLSQGFLEEMDLVEVGTRTSDKNPDEKMSGMFGEIMEEEAKQVDIDPLEVEYVFNFGKHSGKKWADVPADYCEWILENEVWRKREDLYSALNDAGLFSNDSDDERKSFELE